MYQRFLEEKIKSTQLPVVFVAKLLMNFQQEKLALSIFLKIK